MDAKHWQQFNAKVEILKKAVEDLISYEATIEDLQEDLDASNSKISELEIDNRQLDDRRTELIEELETIELTWVSPENLIEEKLAWAFTDKLKKCRNGQMAYADLLEKLNG